MACSCFKIYKQTNKQYQLNTADAPSACRCVWQHYSAHTAVSRLSVRCVHILHVHSLKAQIFFESDTQNIKDISPWNTHSPTAFYSAGVQFKSQPEYRLQMQFSWHSSVTPGKPRNFISIWPRVAPSTSFPTGLPDARLTMLPSPSKIVQQTKSCKTDPHNLLVWYKMYYIYFVVHQHDYCGVVCEGLIRKGEAVSNFAWMLWFLQAVI